MLARCMRVAVKKHSPCAFTHTQQSPLAYVLESMSDCACDVCGSKGRSDAGVPFSAMQTMSFVLVGARGDNNFSLFAVCFTNEVEDSVCTDASDGMDE